MRPATGLKHKWKMFEFSRVTMNCCERCMVIKNDKIADADNCPGVIKLRPFESFIKKE